MSLHRQIAGEIAGKIRSGAWPPGRRLPTEAVLTEEYACARATVNKALSGLVDAGLIERRKRAGSFVARPRMQAAVLEIPDLRVLVEGQGRVYGFELHSREVGAVRAWEANEARLQKGAPVLRLAGVHTMDAVPFAFERRLISLKAAPAALEVDFSAAAPGSWLLQEVSWTEGEHKISAVNPNAQTASALKIPRREACLSLRRWTWREGDSVTFAAQVFRGADYNLTARFQVR